MHGKQSEYLRNSQLKNLLHGTMWRIIGIAILLIVLFIISKIAIKLTGYTLVIVLVLIILFLKGPFDRFITRSYRKPEKTADKFYRGRKGEDAIRDDLEALPDDFHIFFDVTVPGGYGNVDFVIAGPTGVFAVEVKSHRGEVGFDGQELTNNGKRFEKDFLKQAKGEALQVSNFLKNKLQRNIFIQSVLVFSNYVKIHFGMNQVNGVYVIQKYYVQKLITAGSQRLSAEEVTKIKDELQALVTE